MNRKPESERPADPAAAGPLRPIALVIAGVVALVVLLVTIRSQEPVGAGVYYDDGAYLALGRSLAEGNGYAYANLPGHVPGVKYPPAYPAVLAIAWKGFGLYPENLTALKAMSALFWGLAAGLCYLLFARGGRRRLIALGCVTLYAFLTVPSMSVATVLLSEPLFLLACVGALLLAAIDRSQTGADAAAPSAGTRPPGGPAAGAIALGLVGALAFLTRSIGVTLLVALLLPPTVQRRWRQLLLTGVAAGLPAAAWLGWARAHAAAVPAPIAGQYGSYGSWLGQGLEGGALGRIGQVMAANWRPFVETLQFVWVPRAAGLALAVVLVVLGAAAVYGAASAWKRNPALVAFPIAYLAVVFVWPYEPYRFYYVIVPLLTLLAFEGLWEAFPKVRRDLPRWGLPVAIIVGAVFALNALVYHVRGHLQRAWATPQTVPARAYAPLNEWIRSNTRPEEVIASALDPYVYWETGRLAVPSWRFLANDYGRYDRTPEVLAAGLDSVIVRYGTRYVALILGENKAARTLEAFVQLHPERALKLVETEGPAVGVIYALAPPGEALRDPETEPTSGDTGVEGTDGATEELELDPGE